MMIGKTRNSKLLNKVANVDKTSTQRTRKQKLIKMMELMVKEHNASFIIFMHFPNNHESVINVQKLGDFAILQFQKNPACNLNGMSLRQQQSSSN